MKTYQNLEIHLEDNKYLNFVNDLIELTKGTEWKIRPDLVANYKKNSFSSNRLIYCVESPILTFENKEIKGAIWLWDYNGYLEIFNITPLVNNSLDCDEYNYILNSFYELFIVRLIQKYNAQIKLSNPEKQIIETIGNEAYEALFSFSASANKSTGYSHPFDFQRWCDFIFIISRNRIEIGIDELISWLEENGWSNDMAYKLGLQFEYSLRLLERYEQNS